MTFRGDRPIRKRGYHRALKRGDIWALNQKAALDMARSLNKMMWSHTIGLLYQESPFNKMVGDGRIKIGKP